MKFLLDANLPRSSSPLLRGLGHEVEDVRDVLPGGADDDTVAARAQSQGCALVSRDFDFADIRNYPPQDYSGIVVLELPDDATAALVNTTIETFVRNPDFLNRLPSRLAIVSSWRVRFRPA
jgi:predicted nuclease of predicted toxin-antitoxin system